MHVPERDLREKLAEMYLHDKTGDPHDEGFMDAVGELAAWLDERPSTAQGAVSADPAEVERMQKSHAKDYAQLVATAERVEQLEAALEKIAHDPSPPGSWCRGVAQAALKSPNRGENT